MPCTHSTRNCNLIAPCCGRVVCCHKGHDASGSCRTRLEKIGERRRITRMVCGSCGKEQGVRKRCQYCANSFGRYACTICILYDNVDAFHCRECGICRRGRKTDQWHCTNCNCCFPLSSYGHMCSMNLNGPCAFCNVNMRHSTQRNILMRCGHAMHESCFRQRVQRNFSCPTRGCNMTVGDIRRHITGIFGESAAPSSNTTVYCQDCRRTSRGSTSRNYWRCGICGGINAAPISRDRSGASSSRR